jgi:large conductance mechanosensitive channel
MFEEFKKFAIKGNMIDLAVGVVIGGAFGKIVTSLVNDIIMPIMGFITGRINVSTLKLVIRPESKDVTELAIRYGQFLQSSIDFLIIAFSIFLFIRTLNRFKTKMTERCETAPEPSKTELLLADIKELLKKQK